MSVGVSAEASPTRPTRLPMAAPRGRGRAVPRLLGRSAGGGRADPIFYVNEKTPDGRTVVG